MTDAAPFYTAFVIAPIKTQPTPKSNMYHLFLRSSQDRLLFWRTIAFMISLRFFKTTIQNTALQRAVNSSHKKESF
ncbi:hypothetical protein [Paenibacillus sp. NPDC058174]|uniref:hypothetical protein n=1 Tax=Paenibacillus sp. NPDC058174 TaxID=3346366 RepID=UPI0036DEE618